MHDDIDEVWNADMEAAAVGMLTEAQQAKAERLAGFHEARMHPNGTIILRSTMNDHPYVVCDGAMVACDEDTLWQLLSDLDHVIWSDGGEAMPQLRPGDRLASGGASGGARLTFATLTLDSAAETDNSVTAGGMWVHPDFHARGLADAIADVIEGHRPRLGLTAVPPAPEDAELSW